MELTTAYGINIKYSNTSGFERLVTFDSYDIARGAYEAILCSQEAKQATVELEEITVLENGDFEYRTITQNVVQA
jgi:hypothetical protein